MLHPRSSIVPAMVAALLLASCNMSTSQHENQLGLPLVISANVSGTAVALVTVEVQASDIPTPLLFDLSISNSVASGSATIPAGSNRTITMRAYDALGVETHLGSVTMSIQAGTNPVISIVLVPLTGDVGITATLGSVIVTVTPASGSVARAATLQLGVSLKDANGNLLTGTAAWATRDPGVASVDSTGLVTGMGAGSTIVAATFRGATAVASITVTP